MTWSMKKLFCSHIQITTKTEHVNKIQHRILWMFGLGYFTNWLFHVCLLEIFWWSCHRIWNNLLSRTLVEMTFIISNWLRQKYRFSSWHSNQIRFIHSSKWHQVHPLWGKITPLFVCLCYVMFVCLFVCLVVCLFICLFICLSVLV